jgi:hypothetical protein
MQESMRVHKLLERVQVEKILLALRSRIHHDNHIRYVRQQHYDNHNRPFHHDHKQVRKNH